MRDAVLDVLGSCRRHVCCVERVAGAGIRDTNANASLHRAWAGSGMLRGVGCGVACNSVGCLLRCAVFINSCNSMCVGVLPVHSATTTACA